MDRSRSDECVACGVSRAFLCPVESHRHLDVGDRKETQVLCGMSKPMTHVM
ncbi:MAG: hypothetical protein K6G15_01465 [Desulfovibrio sp.]|nr:hypothetical protein [Desulfovibrio sp.]